MVFTGNENKKAKLSESAKDSNLSNSLCKTQKINLNKRRQKKSHWQDPMLIQKPVLEPFRFPAPQFSSYNNTQVCQNNGFEQINYQNLNPGGQFYNPWEPNCFFEHDARQFDWRNNFNGRMDASLELQTLMDPNTANWPVPVDPQTNSWPQVLDVPMPETSLTVDDILPLQESNKKGKNLVYYVFNFFFW